jgi:hypothetical protein
VPGHHRSPLELDKSCVLVWKELYLSIYYYNHMSIPRGGSHHINYREVYERAGYFPISLQGEEIHSSS